MNRAISTVLDVGFAIVLVSASVVVLAGVPAPDVDQRPAVQGGGGAAVAGSTMTVQYARDDGQQAAVTRTVAGHLRDAAIAREQAVGEAYVTAVADDLSDRIETTGTPTQLVGACVEQDGDVAGTETEPVVAGPAPPTGVPVDATLYRWNESAVPASADCRPVVVVRRWSP